MLISIKFWCFMGPHGNFKIELINDVVHIFPSGGFNEQGIREIRDQVLLAAPTTKPWGVLEHPKDLAGLTPEAAKELLKSYQTFSKRNCIVVALEVCSTWQAVIESLLNGDLDIPFHLNSDLEQLEARLDKYF